MVKKLVIENGDCNIWHKETTIIDLMHSALQSQPMTISLNTEGPCADSLGLYRLLDDICARFAFDKRLITIETCNQLESHAQYNIKRSAPVKGVLDLQQQLQQSPPVYKNITKTTKHFGSFVGRGNRMRLAISSYLYFLHGNKTLQSYHTDVKKAYFDQFIGLEELMFHDYSENQISMAIDFLKYCPLKLDKIISYPILHEDKVYDLLDYYQHIFVDMVHQTYFTGNTFYLDDKFWRPIITKTPFMVQGPQWFLKNLKKLGFKTFDQWWDEGYSEDPPDYQVRLILENIDMISSWDSKRLRSVYEDMKPTLDHNFEVFMFLDHKTFNKAFNFV